MLSKIWPVLLTTAIAPVLWGTTYCTTTTFLVHAHPLLTASLRALPAGLILLCIARRRPRGAWWWKSAVLGVLNIGLFFASLFVAAERLPGGVAAVIGGIQPLLVAVLASRLVSERLSGKVVAAGAGGVVGVALIVLRAQAGLDPIGIAAAVLGAVSMATGVVLTKRWSDGQTPIVTTSWQLIAGGIFLAAATTVFEPLPVNAPTFGNITGYAYLTLAGTALAYLLWFRGITLLPTRVPAFLGPLSPIVALTIGGIAAGETLTWIQATGVALILLSVATIIRNTTQNPARPPPGKIRGQTHEAPR